MSINTYSKEQVTNFLADLMPQGRAFSAKYYEGSNLRRYLEAKSIEFKRFLDYLSTFLTEITPENTQIYIEEWESALGIPDDCIPLATTDDERRENIVLKLASLAIKTEEDYIHLASQFGFTIEFYVDGNYPPYDVPYTPLEEILDHVLPPYDVPYTPASESTINKSMVIVGNFSENQAKADIFQCLVKKLSPANKTVIFYNDPLI